MDPNQNKTNTQSHTSPALTQRQNPNTASNGSPVEVPSIALPKGGGAIKGIEEKFQVNAVTGTSSFAIPIPVSSSRHGFVPALALSYNSGGGNSAFGLGWELTIPRISRKTENKLPRYQDEEESDTFVLSGAEDLVPLLEQQGAIWESHSEPRIENGVNFIVKRYRPRIEGLFARIERWKNAATGATHWRTITKTNVHSYYGLTAESRISDPQDESRVFEWLLCRTHDDKGNVSIYQYKKEDFVGIPEKLNEKNRVGKCIQAYLKKVSYGNKQPYYLGDAMPGEDGFLFTVVFDYGEHDPAENIPKDIDQEKNNWACRKDAFSSYRSGFEIRTYRRCSRVLVFHCFEANELPHDPYLTKSLQLFYEDDLKLEGNNSATEGFSFLVKAKQNGHLWDGGAGIYKTKFLPETEIAYQQHQWNTTVQTVKPEDLVHAPVGIGDRQYLWIDLYSEGIAGILTEQATGWFYKSNKGDGKFTPARLVSPKPSFAGLTDATVTIQELEGDGSKYLVHDRRQPKGFFKLTDDEDWEPFTNFSVLPNVHPADKNARLIDLTGDGKADLLFSDDYALRWYASLGEKGFETSEAIAKEIDEEKGPAIIFAERELSIFLADMNGDGLTDIVRIRNGEICYWPNLGYGRFGAKVSMDGAPFFESPDAFNPAFLRLADIDGSGTTDVVYLGKNDFRIWMNLNGNEWAGEPKIINYFPQIDNLADVAVLDFLGSGTACIVYSSPVSQQPLQYIDLMGSKKPGLFSGYQNNCGKTVSLRYKSSTHFYLEDKEAGRKWITKLPFPVHCIAEVRSEDKIRETVFTNSYRYSHGYFDHEEKEFRGFARVEQLDTEAFAAFRLNDARNVVEEDLHQAPVKTISWFHTGAFIRKEKILQQCRDEYFKNEVFDEYDLPELEIINELPDNTPHEFSSTELREALRACKGILLRTEVYAQDGTAKTALPYSASQSTCTIKMVQPTGSNKHASFLVLTSEAISYGYERNPADPRMSHSFVLEVDNLGNVTKSASIVYPRVARPVAPDDVPDKVWTEQSKSHVVYNEAFYTDDVISDAVYRLRTSYESRSFEVSGINIAPGSFVSKTDLLQNIALINNDPGKEIFFEDEFNGSLQKRLLGQTRVYFLRDDLSAPLPLGKLSSLGIVHKQHTLAFTKGLVSKYYGAKVTDAMLTNAKYLHLEGDDKWWTQSGIALYAPNPRNNYYTPIGARDVFGNESFVEYDHYSLLVKSTTDAVGNKASAVNDYRTLSPVMLTDANMNRSAVETDELGLVIKAAVMGKEGAGEGDTLADPTRRMEYDLLNWKNNQKPNYVHSFAREKHGAANPRWQEGYAYSDGSGNAIMTKVQANPGKAMRWNAVTKRKEEVDANPRWIGNGRSIFNNKGNPVKQYEPYFSTTHEYESESALVETGVTSVLNYDPLGRNTQTDFSNGTFAKVEFDSWYSKSYDVNDTVKDSQWYIDRGSPDPLVVAEPADPEQRAAWLAAKHHGTPNTAFTDSLGRAVHSVTDYGGGKTTSVYSETDLAGRYSKVFDQLGRMVSEGAINLLGQTMYGKTAEKGERWVFADVMGRLVRIWDNDIREMRCSFDSLHRPVSTFVKEGVNETLFGHVVYGELFPDAEAKSRNLKGRAYQLYDQAGVVTVKNIDFKGNATEAERRLANEYKQAVNWAVLANLNDIDAIQTAADPMLEDERFTSSSDLDALNRPVTVTLPDRTVIEPKYNEANFLASLKAQIRGTGDFVSFLQNQDYDAKGQRKFAKYGNNAITNYFYDPQSFRLVNLVTRLSEGDAEDQAVQNLTYHFDSVGNITQIRDDAQQTHFFRNAVVFPESKFEYDAVYQLKRATGREHAGLGSDAQRNEADLSPLQQLPHLNDAAAVRNYEEQYEYDDCGNIKALRHSAPGAVWNQRYKYEYEDDAANRTNRLKATSLPGDADGVFSAPYSHNRHGNMTSMPHLSAADSLKWNFMDQLKEVNLGGGGRAYYVYGLGGNRIRKIIERNGGKRLERIYLGAVEIYRERQGSNAPDLERYTLHISDNTRRIAQVDTKTIDTANSDPANNVNESNIRYQYSNHLGSAVLETDKDGVVISYEEYHPYGTTAYRNSRSGTDLSLKRYRFSGKERDDETGFYYFGARYYAAWLGRWTSSDPAGFVRGTNLYTYCSNNPVMYFDPNGMQERLSFGLPDWATPQHSPGQRGYEEEVRTIGRRLGEEGRRLGYEFSNTSPVLRNGGWDFGTFGTIPENDPWNITGVHTPSASSTADQPSNSGSSSGATAPIMPNPNANVTAPGTTSPQPTLQQGTIPSAPPGTNHAQEAARGRAAYRAANPMPPGTQAQHWTKEISSRNTGIAPSVMNQNMSPLQSRNRLPATTLLTDPSGRGTTYSVSGGSTYGNEHKFADRYLIPEIENQIRQANPNADPREVAVQAGRQARWIMTGDPGPDATRTPAPQPSLMSRVGNFAGAFGGSVARTFIPGFVEAEVSVIAAPHILAYYGVTNATLTTGAAALAAAPAASALIITGSAIGGYAVGDAVESVVTEATGSRAVGVGAGTLAGAATGAAIGAAVGSVVPVIGTAVGAVVGGVVGGIAGFIGSFW